MLVATFTTATGWAGRSITWDSGVFTLEGHGHVKARDVLAYDEQGQLEWADAELRDWVVKVAQYPELAPGVRWVGSYGADAAYADIMRQPSPPGSAVAGLLLGVVGFLLPVLVFWWIGLYLSRRGYRQAVREGLPRGFALAGYILNAVMTVVSAVAVVVVILVATL